MNPYEYFMATEGGLDPIYFRHNIVTGMVQVFTDVGEWFDQPHITIETVKWAYTPDSEDENVSISIVRSTDLPAGVTP